LVAETSGLAENLAKAYLPPINADERRSKTGGNFTPSCKGR
jgi:hypothetical protein